MSYFRCFLLVASLAVGLLGASSSAWLTASSTPAAPPLLPSAPDPACLRDLGAALDALDARRVQWLETTLWQRVRLPDLEYEVDGRYLTGPGHCVRLELTTHVGQTAGALLLVSDGTTLWEAARTLGTCWNRISKVDLRLALAPLEGRAGAAQVQAAFFREHSFTGVRPLLEELRRELVWGRREGILRGGREYVKLTGFAPGAADLPWPEGRPRQCRLYLDPQTAWPHRVEWWGPLAQGGADVPLIQTEFRNPVINRPLSPERAACEFTFEPGALPVTDDTLPTADRLLAEIGRSEAAR